MTDLFLPKFKLPYGVISSVDAICLLTLPNSLIYGIVERSNFYAMARTNVSPTIVEGDVIKKNPCYMHPKNYRTLTRRNILYFFACYYYMGHCCLPAKGNYWKQRQRNSCLPSHWIDGVFPRHKFEYVWRNISMDSSLLNEKFNNTIGEGGDG